MKQKKGEFDSLTRLILILVSAVVLFGVIFIWTGVISTSSSKSVCQLSLISASMTKIGGFEGFQIHCEMEKVNITSDLIEPKKKDASKYMEDYKNKNTEDSFINSEPAEFVLNKEIGTRMAKAWSQVGEGKLDLFSNYWKPIKLCKDGNSWKKTDECELYKPWDWNVELQRPINCILFTTFYFKEDLRTTERLPSEIKSLTEWLKKNKAPGKNGVSYYDYLLNDGQPSVFQYDFRYSIEKPLSIVFVRANNFAGEETAKSLANSAYGLIFDGQLVGDVKAKSYLLLIPYDEVSKYCTVIMN
jgi:hypothetical protein